MSIFEQVSAQLTQAMRDRDKEKTTALRNIRAAFIEGLKLDASESLSDEKATEILRKVAKQRRESIEAFTAGDRKDLADAEARELAIVDAFLPRLADEATLRAWVEAAVKATGAAGMHDVGKVMSAVMASHRDEVDGRAANRIARELLAPRGA
jgi:uncharacterized protein YqeY